MMKKNSDGQQFYFAVLAGISALIVIFLHVSVFAASSIGDIDQLHFALSGESSDASSPTWIDDWFSRYGTPVTHGFLGKLLLWGVYSAVNVSVDVSKESAFYYSYVATSFFLLAATLFTFGVFSRKLVREFGEKINNQAAAVFPTLCMAIFSLSAPILFLTKFPVHGTPNDLLGFWFALMALMALLDGRIIFFCVLSTIGVFSLGTTLLIPFIFMFFSHRPLQQRVIATIVPVATFLVSCMIWPGNFDAIDGVRANFQIPIESLIFALLTFGPWWIFGILGYLELKKTKLTKNGLLHALVESFPWSLALIFSITLAFASLHEMRVAFILFFYFIPFSAFWLYKKRIEVLKFVKNKYFILGVVASLVVTFRFWVWMIPASVEDVETLHRWLGVVFSGASGQTDALLNFIVGDMAGPQHNWITITTVYLFLFLVCLQFLFVRKPKIRLFKSQKRK